MNGFSAVLKLAGWNSCWAAGSSLLWQTGQME